MAATLQLFPQLLILINHSQFSNFIPNKTAAYEKFV